MNWAHLHLLLNHLPVVGMLLVLPLLVWGIWKRSQDLMRASLSLLIVLAIIAIVVFFTGEPAEELVEHLPGVSEAMIESHEEAALFATVSLAVTGALAFAGLMSFHRQSFPLRFPVVLLVLALVPAGAMAWTANLGGQIRHSEIRSEAAVDVQLSAVEADSPRQADRSAGPHQTSAERDP